MSGTGKLSSPVTHCDDRHVRDCQATAARRSKLCQTGESLDLMLAKAINRDLGTCTGKCFPVCPH